MRRIIIVDDNPTERKMLSGILSKKYDVQETDSVANMREILRKSGKSVSAILLDIVMPQADGYAALRIIRENAVWRQIPVIVTTALTDEESQVKALALGANGFVSKPFNSQLLQYTLENTIELHEKSALANAFRRDKLTGLYNREGFLETADRMIRMQKPGYYILSCFDVDNFKVINDQYGTQKGDEVLCHIAHSIEKCVTEIDGICCRFMADKFGMLYPAEYKDSDIVIKNHRDAAQQESIGKKIKIRIGRYIVDDLSIPISAMYDRAKMAEESIKNRYDEYIAEYTESMRSNLVHEQDIVNLMDSALKLGQFEPWFQPQYNHATGGMIGAEALVRWKKDGTFISPAEFIPVFERNGFIYEMDMYIWESVCKHLRRWIDEGRNPLPVSVNISRRDLFHKHCISVLENLVHKYNLPYDLLRLEVTESAFSESSKLIVSKVDELIKLGFTVEIDDFGSGYSSLNTLKDVPASILKLDMKFFENTENTQRGGNIVESIVRMAKWLGMSTIAEGVEEKAQADYLQSIGCNYIQGYFYSKPLPLDKYECLLDSCSKEHKLSKLTTLDNLNNNEFWNPKSMETLIFNSYVGGACIFEYHNGKTELLRVNEQYKKELGCFGTAGSGLDDNTTDLYLDSENQQIMLDNIRNAIETQKESLCELVLSDGERFEYIRSTVRVIAKAGERYLLYCVIINHTAQHMAVLRQLEAEKRQKESAHRLEVIMGNVNGGVSAITVDNNGKSEMVFCNEKYYELYGYTKEQITADKIDIMSLILYEDFPDVMERIRELKRTRQPIIIDYRCRRHNGEIAYLRANSSLMHIDGYGDDVITSVITDITTERENVEKLTLLTNNIPGGLAKFKVSKKGIETLYLSNGVFHLTGYSKDELASLSRGNALYLADDEDPEMLMHTLDTMLREQKEMDCNFRAKLKNGQLRWVNIRASIAEMHKNYAVINVVFLDIMDKKHTEEKLIQSQRETRQRYERELHLRQELVKDSPVSLVFNLTTNTIEDYQSTISPVPRKDAIGTSGEKHCKDLIDNVFDEDKERVRNTIFPDKLLEAYERNETYLTVEFRRRTAHKEYHWVKTTVAITKRPDSDEVIAFLYVKDINIEKKNQLAIESVIDREIESISLINVKSGLQRIVSSKNELSYVDKRKMFNHDEVALPIIDRYVLPEYKSVCKDSLMLEKLIARLDAEGQFMLSFSVNDVNGEVRHKRTLAYYLDETHEEIVISDRDDTDVFNEEQH